MPELSDILRGYVSTDYVSLSSYTLLIKYPSLYKSWKRNLPIRYIKFLNICKYVVVLSVAQLPWSMSKCQSIVLGIFIFIDWCFSSRGIVTSTQNLPTVNFSQIKWKIIRLLFYASLWKQPQPRSVTVYHIYPTLRFESLGERAFGQILTLSDHLSCTTSIGIDQHWSKQSYCMDTKLNIPPLFGKEMQTFK